MRIEWRPTFVVLFAAVAVAMVSLVAMLWSAEPAGYTPSRTPEGQPDLNGIWQAVNTANWDIQDHEARPGPLASLGAAFSVPGGRGVVEGNEIPYLPGMAAKKKENADHWITSDPEVKCYMPGVPRATYMPYPFQIAQNPDHILIAYEFASASRIIAMNSTAQSPGDAWMGWSTGRWDGNTLVVDVKSFNDQTWFDRAGNFHSDALHVIERYTPVATDRLQYDVTIEDPKVFSRPWKMSMPLYRRSEPNARLTEYKCVDFAEELLYGHLRRQTDR